MPNVICCVCQKKNKIAWASQHLHCPNCKRITCNDCLTEPGMGFIRRGFCPHCGFELQNEHEVKKVLKEIK